MKNYKLKIKNGSSVLRTSFKRLRRKKKIFATLFSAGGVLKSHVVHKFCFSFFIFHFSFLILLFSSNGCSVLKMLKAQYDPQGTQYAVTLRHEALELMAKAGESYYLHSEEVYQLMSGVEAAYENARPQRKNKVITGIWDQMRSPKGNRLGGFIAQWKREGRLTAERIEAVKKWVDEDFQAIIALEKKKSRKLGKIQIKK